MLPFLDHKKLSSIMIAKRAKGDVEVKPEVEVGEGVHPDLKMIAEDIMRAVQDKSVVDLAKCLHEFFEVADSMPHAEGEPTEEQE